MVSDAALERVARHIPRGGRPQARTTSAISVALGRPEGLYGPFFTATGWSPAAKWQCSSLIARHGWLKPSRNAMVALARSCPRTSSDATLSVSFCFSLFFFMSQPWVENSNVRRPGSSLPSIAGRPNHLGTVEDELRRDRQVRLGQQPSVCRRPNWHSPASSGSTSAAATRALSNLIFRDHRRSERDPSTIGSCPRSRRSAVTVDLRSPAPSCRRNPQAVTPRQPDHSYA